MFNSIKLASALSLMVFVGVTAPAAQAADVKITPLGSIEGEFCAFDRTVAGATDPRLGKIDALLVSHMHGDHAGDRHIPAPNAGECGKPDVSVVSVPNTNTVDIALAQGAVIITGSEMPTFFAAKLKAVGGDPKNSKLVRFGANFKLGGVVLTTVPAVHSNGISGAMVGGQLGKDMNDAGLTAYAGPPTGYVLTFSNGLVVYLSGDTGVTAEQKVVVGDQYKAKLVVMNIGDTYTTGPKEAAFVINELIKPASVIASHANEPATEGGKVRAGTKTETFMKAVTVPVHIPLSGKAMSFDGMGKCTSGC